MATLLPTLYGRCLTINPTFSENYAINVMSSYGLSGTNGFLYIQSSPRSGTAGDGASLVVQLGSDIFAASYVNGSGETNHCGDKTYMSIMTGLGGAVCRVNVLKYLADNSLSSVVLPCRATQSDINGLGASNSRVGWRIGNTGPAAVVAANLTSCPGTFTQTMAVTVTSTGIFST